MQRLDAQRSQLFSEIRRLQGEMLSIQREAERLRDEWLRVTDAYGYLERSDYERAIAIFGEWIVLEGGNPAPYVARSAAYSRLGRKAEAAADMRVSALQGHP